MIPELRDLRACDRVAVQGDRAVAGQRSAGESCAGIERDRLQRQNRSLEYRVRSQGRGAADLPEDVLSLRIAGQNNLRTSQGGQR